jgi:hydrogenase maturation protease
MTTKRILVLGIGNILWADEGFGVRCVEALNAGWQFPPQVTLMDGGTQGLYLLPYVQEADCLLVFDAVDYGDEPGKLREVIGDQVPRFMGAKKMSLHQTGFQEVLMAAELTNKLPKELVLIGVQPEELEDYGGSLRDIVKAQMQPARVKAGPTASPIRRWPLRFTKVNGRRPTRPTASAMRVSSTWKPPDVPWHSRSGDRLR